MKATLDLRGKRALVMGLGVNGGGVGVTRFLAEQGATVTVTDLRSEAVLAPSLATLQDLPVRYVLGQHREADFRATDLVIRNPGVPRESPFLAVARATGAAIEMEMTLFFRLCPGPILGVTGTRGKTTTTLLLADMLRRHWPDTVMAGNMRVSALEQLPHITPTTPVALELSSWQLEGLDEAGLSPHGACVTNLSPDHLDRYASMEAYAEAKRAIVAHQSAADVAVLNAGDPVVATFADHTPARLVGFAACSTLPPWAPDRLIVAHRALHTTIGAPPGTWELICGAADLMLLGDHNLLNVAAAAGLALAVGVPLADVQAAARAFRGVPDRLEPVRDLDAVLYINDTTATTPTATLAALAALDRPVVLIAGGSEKHLPLDGLPAAIAEHARAVVLLAGSGTPRLAAELSRLGDRVAVTPPCDSLAQAVTEARRAARPGDAVLLSPAFASFGMFTNEFDRGAQFRAIVEQLT
ncbi:MAG: UDP-N-acetylmuramoyl-L-alanine--D-glutamate ligase [Herpetosiphon sp.]